MLPWMPVRQQGRSRLQALPPPSLRPPPAATLHRKGQTDVVRLLLDSGGKASLKDVNKRGLTALGEALLAGHTDVAKALTTARLRHHFTCGRLQACMLLALQLAAMQHQRAADGATETRLGRLHTA